jgi:hypothetical protein
MRPFFVMHRSTWEYLVDQINNGKKPVEKMKYNGEWSFAGYDVRFEHWLKPTINEGKGYIFPKEPFVTYEQKDAGWCEYFGIGRWGKGVIFGEVYVCNPSSYDITPTNNRATVKSPYTRCGFEYFNIG